MDSVGMGCVGDSLLFKTCKQFKLSLHDMHSCSDVFHVICIEDIYAFHAVTIYTTSSSLTM